MHAMFWMTVVVGLLLAAGPALAAEAPQPMTEADLKAVLADAPPVPEIDLALELEPIDFIDCTDPDDPHAMKDQGTSRVVDGPAGRYRITAAHRHAFFGYRFYGGGTDEPILIVVEYPDDARRTINFSTHESLLSGGRNADWSLETGVYTGDPLPLSNRMQHHTFVMYPQDQWPAVLVGNFARYGHPAAASRIWVCRIVGGLPKLEIDPPDPGNQRAFGHYNSIHFLPTSFHFGARSPKAIEHMLDYSEYVGINRWGWSVVYNNSWGFSCTIPAWDGGADNDHLDRVLRAMDARGGFSFIAGFAPPEGFKIGGTAIKDMPDDELAAALNKGFDQFFERYGKFDSLAGITLGAQFGSEFTRVLHERGLLDDVVGHIKANHPGMLVGTYVGGPHLHRPYFYGGDGAPSAWEIVSRWQDSGAPWPEFLGQQAGEAWPLWGIAPPKLRRVDGLTLIEQLQPDDHHIFGLYAQEPRAMIYYDLDRSQARSDIVDTPHAALWNTHYEGWYGLHPEVNFWYRKLWVAPDFNAPPPLSMASFARALALRDRLSILPGSWNNKYFGYEAAARKFATAFRSLPPVPMDEADMPIDTAVVRWVRHGGKRYVYAVSRIPFEQSIEVDDRSVVLQPYGLLSWSDGSDDAPKVTGKPSETYLTWVAGRIDRYEKLLDTVRSLNADAVPEAYAEAAKSAREALEAGDAYRADVLLGAGLAGELELRRDILDPPAVRAPKVASAPAMTGNLDDWPAEASDIEADDGSYLAGHLYFPNSWHGPDDLSVRLRLANDGEFLYVGAHVRDDTHVGPPEDPNTRKPHDSLAFRLSTDGAYRNWRGDAQRPNVVWPIELPAEGTAKGSGARGFTYICTRTDNGYVVEGKAPLTELGAEPGGRVGFLVFASDVDGLPNIYPAGWAAKQAMLVPHRPNFQYWSDARNLGQLVIGQ